MSSTKSVLKTETHRDTLTTMELYSLTCLIHHEEDLKCIFTIMSNSARGGFKVHIH